MDWMYSNCSRTAQIGATEWADEFEYENYPIFQRLYERVKSGYEAGIVLKTEKPDISHITESEMWTVGKEIRKFRPKT